MHFLSFPGKLLQLPVTLAYPGHAIQQYSWKNLCSEKAICKNHETFNTKQQQYCGILGLQEYFDNPEMQHDEVSWDSMAFQRSTVPRGTTYG